MERSHTSCTCTRVHGQIQERNAPVSLMLVFLREGNLPLHTEWVLSCSNRSGDHRRHQALSVGGATHFTGLRGASITSREVVSRSIFLGCLSVAWRLPDLFNDKCTKSVAKVSCSWFKPTTLMRYQNRIQGLEGQFQLRHGLRSCCFSVSSCYTMHRLCACRYVHRSVSIWPQNRQKMYYSQVKIETKLFDTADVSWRESLDGRCFASCVSTDSRWKWRVPSRILHSSASLHPTKFSARDSLHSTTPFTERAGWNNQGSTR